MTEHAQIVEQRGRNWRSSYVDLHMFMASKLGLSGSQLICLSAIFGFTQDGSSKHIPIQFMRFFSGTGKTATFAALKRLETTGLIKRKKVINPWKGGKMNAYIATSSVTDCHLRVSADSQMRINTDYSELPSLFSPEWGQVQPPSDHATIRLWGYMVSDLALSGCDLICYAALMDACALEGRCTMPLGYLAQWCGVTRQTVRRCLSRLSDRALIKIHRKQDASGVFYNWYEPGHDAN